MFSLHDELIVGPDAALRIDDQEFQADGGHLVALATQHLPVKANDIAELARIRHGPKPVAVIAHVLFVRAGDPLFELIIAPHLAVPTKCSPSGIQSCSIWRRRDAPSVSFQTAA